jgi:hypothetical protein
MFSWKRGGSRTGETEIIIWRIPSCKEERCENLAFQIQTASQARVAIYAGLVTRHIFFARAVKPRFISSKAAAMLMYGHITRLPKDVGKARDYVVRMAELALSTHDFGIMQDLRSLNGRHESPLYDVFLERA